jgi:hypothetical protein
LRSKENTNASGMKKAQRAKRASNQSQCAKPQVRAARFPATA